MLRVGLLLNYSAALQQGLERFGVVKKQTVIDHVLIVCGQLGQGTVIRDELECAIDGRMVVDDLALVQISESARLTPF